MGVFDVYGPEAQREWDERPFTAIRRTYGGGADPTTGISAPRGLLMGPPGEAPVADQVGPTLGERVMGGLRAVPGAAQRGLQMMQNPAPGQGWLPQALSLVGSVGRRLPAAMAAGRGDLALAGALNENALNWERQAAIAQELTQRRLDPMNPADQSEIFNIFSKYGAHDMAQQYASMLQSGNIEAMKLAQNQAKIAAELAPQLSDMFKFRDAYGKKAGDNGAAYDEAVVAVGRIEEAVDAYLGDPSSKEGVPLEEANPMAYQVAAVAFQKLLDPTSVVRESEYARSEEFQSLFEKMVNLWVKAKTGGVQPQIMRDLGMMARRLALRYSKYQSKRYDAAHDLIRSWGHDPQMTLSTFTNPHEQVARLERLLAQSDKYGEQRASAYGLSEAPPLPTAENGKSLAEMSKAYFAAHPELDPNDKRNWVAPYNMWVKAGRPR